jgi:hypothetical protein
MFSQSEDAGCFARVAQLQNPSADLELALR